MPDANVPFNGPATDPLFALGCEVVGRVLEWTGWLLRRVRR